MRAYAILDGGGVKGAALAGCLKAAEEQGIRFVGYGGTSAGSIVALLACIGYSGEDLRRIMIDEVEFTKFLDDGGAALDRLKSIFRTLQPKVRTIFWAYCKHRKFIHAIQSNHGLYHAQALQNFLLRKIKEKLPALAGKNDITFHDLKEQGCAPLKIVVSDVGFREPKVYSASGGDELNGSVIDAVRASMSYPLVFRPVPINNRFLVDGGLSINLPVFLFEKEREVDKLPIVAFDLVSSPSEKAGAYKFHEYCGDMLATALESSAHLLQRVLKGIYYVSVDIPNDIDTLDFNLTVAQRQQLFDKGHSSAHTFFSTQVKQWTQAQTLVEQLQALHAPSDLVVTALRAFAIEFESGTPATNVRANISLPTDRETLIVVYQYKMDQDPDMDLELRIDAGCSGKAWTLRRPVVADLVDAKTTFTTQWKMTQAQQNKVRADRKAMLSVPMFDLRRSSPVPKSVDDLEIIGILSLDTDTSLENTLWLTSKKEYVEEMALRWADILSRIIV